MEVVLALGVVVFCLIAVFSLLTVGVTTSQSATARTTASLVLNAISADIRSTPQTTSATNSAVYGITLPAVSASATTTAPNASSPLYIDEDGTTNTAAVGARYRMFVWTTSAASSAPVTQETLVRVILAWPAGATNYTSAEGYVEGSRRG